MKSSLGRAAALAAAGVLGLAIGVPGPAAQEAPDSSMGKADGAGDSVEVYHLDEVLVTAARLPAGRALYFSNVTVADRSDLSEISSSTVSEALTIDSGIGLARYGSYGSLQTMAFRGGGSNEVVYLLDGVPLADPQVGTIDQNWLPVSGTMRVEAMKGGASALYGSGAVGGVVNLVSMSATPAVPSSEITFWNGSYGSRSVGVALRRSLVGGLGILGSYDYLKSDGWISNSAYKGEKFYGKVAGLAGGVRLEAVGFRHAGDVEVPGSFPGRQSDDRTFLRLSASGQGEHGFTVSCYHSGSDQTYISLGADGDYRYDHVGGIDGLQMETFTRSADSTASSVGIGIEHKTLESNSVGDRSAGDAYASYQREMSAGPLRVSASFRLEKNSGFGAEVAPQVAAWLKLADRLSVFTKLDRSFAYPTFNDLYWRGPNEAGDPGLETEHSAGLEVGALLERGCLRASSTVYYRALDDMILWRTGESCQTVRSTNAQATLKGMEIALQAASAAGVELGLSYWLGSAVDEAGKPLEYKPANIFAWHARADRRLTSHLVCGAALSGRRVSKVSTGDQFDYVEWTCLRGTSLPGYSSALFYGYAALDRGRVFVRVNNLFDDRIPSTWGMPDLPSRSYEVGLGLEVQD
jgi:vitamin B12 transporter